MKRLWNKVVGFWHAVAWIVVFAIVFLPAIKKVSAQGAVPPVIVPGSWTTIDLSLPALGEYQQPLIYEEWWKEIGECEHVTVPLELTRRVHFVYVNAPSMIVDMEPGIMGFTDAPRLTIYIVLPLIYNKSVISHEMLHWLDYVNGIDEGKNFHPPSRFGVGTMGVCGVTRFYYR